MLNKNSLDTLCAALCYALGIDAPEQAAEPNADLCKYIDEKLIENTLNKVTKIVTTHNTIIGTTFFFILIIISIAAFVIKNATAQLIPINA